jgi:hypothetical protein
MYAPLALPLPMYCQITACKDGRRTGVDQNGVLCRDQCAAVACAKDQRRVPCRLPHQTRCDDVWPLGKAVAPAFSGRARAAWAGGEVNLLSESLETDEANGGFEWFASFKNTLMTLGDPAHEYQCVWNAAGITEPGTGRGRQRVSVPAR